MSANIQKIINNHNQMSPYSPWLADKDPRPGGNAQNDFVTKNAFEN